MIRKKVIRADWRLADQCRTSRLRERCRGSGTDCANCTRGRASDRARGRAQVRLVALALARVTSAVVLIRVVGTVNDTIAPTRRREAHPLRLAVERQRVVEARVAISFVLAVIAMVVTVATENTRDSLGKAVRHCRRLALERFRAVACAQLGRLVRTVRALLHVIAHLLSRDAASLLVDAGKGEFGVADGAHAVALGDQT